MMRRLLIAALTLWCSCASAQMGQIPNVAQLVPAPAAGYTAQGVHFSSTGPQQLTDASPLTGVTDGTVGLLSFWFRAEGSDANVYRIFASQNAGGTVNAILVDRLNSGCMRLILQNSSGSNLVSTCTTSTVFTAANGNWHHYIASWTMGGSPNIQVFVDGVVDTNGAPSSGTIAYATGGAKWELVDAGLPMDADVADLWFDTGIAFPSQLNLTVSTNLQKFINGGNAVNLGTNGATPSGTSPPVFFSGSTISAWNTNKGSGGGFALVNGPLTAASSNPP